MINFGKLSKTKSSGPPAKLVELFEQLDRKASHGSLRPVQIEVLNALDEQIKQRDIVIKLSTGSGKTVAGLVYAEYMRRKYPGEMVLYLSPTNQLVEQVIHTGSLIGVPVDGFPKESHPHQAVEGKSVLACTYDRLFNSKNVFTRNNFIPSTILLDDVHSGVDRVRNAFTATVPDKVHARLRAIFEPLCEPTDPAIWRGIANNESDARYEVPFWIWIPQCGSVGKILEEVKTERELLFRWSNIARYLEYARLCISGTTVEISMPVAPSEENLAYASAKHRLFMSASIKDGTGLIRDLDCSHEALKRIIEPPSDRGAGERMILPVSLIDPALKKAQIADLCAAYAKRANVVVLTSSGKQTASWVEAGAVMKQGDEVDAAVSQLRNTVKGLYMTFAQRFDGIDLPDDACRILVIDGTPSGERLCDQIDIDRQKNSPGYNVRVVNRFEQALGRAVRSSADYAAILLVGSDIAAFVGRRDVKDLLESHTREQIDLGKALAEQLKQGGADSAKAIASAVDALLERDEGWKEAHRERIAAIPRGTRAGAGLTISEMAAVAEREAWLLAKSRNHQGAVAVLQTAADEPAQHPVQRAELLFRMAGFMHQFDSGKAAALYRGAFQINSLLPRPIQLPDRRYSRVREQAVNLRDYFGTFTNVNAAVSRLEEIRAKLPYSGNSELVERALFELGEALGASSSRPEKETGRGPDVLWIFDDLALCIEAKSEKYARIWKADAEQLLLSMEWCTAQTDVPKDKVVPVFATNSLDVDRPEDISYGPRFMTESVVLGIVDSLCVLVNGISYEGPLFIDPATINRRVLDERLTGREIVGRLQAK